MGLLIAHPTVIFSSFYFYLELILSLKDALSSSPVKHSIYRTKNVETMLHASKETDAR